MTPAGDTPEGPPERRPGAGRRLPPGVRPLPGTPAAPTKVSDALDRVLKRLGVPASVSGVEVVFERWPAVVGEAMAARTRPLSIDGEALVVGCDEPALASHVRFLEPQLVARLAELAGERRITRVEVRVERPGRRRPPPPRPRPAHRGGRR
jgi:hypothetical protein